MFRDLSKPFEAYKKDCVFFLASGFGSDRSGYTQLLLREFLLSDDNFQDRLAQVQKHIFLRYVLAELLTVNTVSEMLSQGRSEKELSLLFTNILLSCRLLPTRNQEALYENMGDFYLTAKYIARIHRQQFPKMESN
jgi:hypothetical protein